MDQSFTPSFDIARMEQVARKGKVAVECLRDFNNEYRLLSRMKDHTNLRAIPTLHEHTRYGKGLTGVLLAISLAQEYLRQLDEIDKTELQEEHLKLIEASEGKAVRKVIEDLQGFNDR